MFLIYEILRHKRMIQKIAVNVISNRLSERLDTQ